MVAVMASSCRCPSAVTSSDATPRPPRIPSVISAGEGSSTLSEAISFST